MVNQNSDFFFAIFEKKCPKIYIKYVYIMDEFPPKAKLMLLIGISPSH